MKYIPHHYRQADMQRLLRGKFLCEKPGSEVPPGGPSTVEIARERVAEFLKWVAEKGSFALGEGTQALKEWATAIPKGILDGLKDAWKNGVPNQETVSELFSSMASFFRAEPSLRTMFEKHLTIFDATSLMKLTDHTEWINALRELQGTDFLQNKFINPPIPDGEIFGPREFLLSLPVAERQQAYLSFINQYIPASVQRSNKWDGKSPDEQIKNIDKNKEKEVINDTLEAILGIIPDDKVEQFMNDNKPDTVKARKAAIASLSQYYEKDNPDFPHRIPTKLDEDYDLALKYESMGGQSGLATNPQRLGSRLHPSQFKGALQLGVVDHKLLEYMYPIVRREKNFEERQVKNRVRGELENLTGATKEKLRSNAESLKDSWNGLHPGIKLAAIAAMLYGVFSSKIVRGAALGMGGIYLFQKLILKDKDPVEGWASLVRSPFDALKEKNAKDFGQSITPGTVEELESRSNLYVKFLKKFDYVNMEKQSVALALLNDMPLSLIAKNFHAGEPAGESFSLNIQGMDVPMQKAMEKRGWKGGYKRYFTQHEVRRQSAEAIGWVFYQRAKQDPNNAEDVREIEAVRGSLLPGSSVSRLPSPYMNADPMKNQRYASSDPEKQKQMKRAQQLYVRLVGHGQELFEGDGRPLGEFVVSTMAIPLPAKPKFNPGAVPNKKTVDGDVPHKREGDPGDAPKKRVDSGGVAGKRTGDPGEVPDKKASAGGIPERRDGDIGDIPDGKGADAGDAPNKKEGDAGEAPDSRKGDEGRVPDERKADLTDAPTRRKVGTGTLPNRKEGEPGGTAESRDPEPGGDPFKRPGSAGKESDKRVAPSGGASSERESTKTRPGERREAPSGGTSESRSAGTGTTPAEKTPAPGVEPVRNTPSPTSAPDQRSAPDGSSEERTRSRGDGGIPRKKK